MNKLSKLTKYQQTNRIPIISKAFNSLNSSKTSTASRGFTIIALLIVIVIIGILVAITAVSYNGITKQAKEATAKSDLKQASTQLEIDRTKSSNNQYPSTTSGLKSSPGTNLEITSTGTTYCLSAIIPSSISFHITNTNTAPQPGVCSGHLPADAPTELANNTPIQDVNRLQCNALPIYDGTNDSALRTVTDDRDGTTRSYRIAKLADNKCWMLDNLKLGKTTGTTTLTPANTNIATNFTLPKVAASAPYSREVPNAFGPVPGDTGSGATNYGYLYNWPAATAGETPASMPTGGVNAMYSICPVGWRLPSGGWDADWTSAVGDYPDLDKAFGGTGEYERNGPSLPKWQNNGPFKGVFSGLGGGYSDTFRDQSSYGVWWTSTTSLNDGALAFYVELTLNYVAPDSGDAGDGRDSGLAVRCLLN